MRTTIDSAGRILVPKDVRDALGLAAGAPVDLLLRDGRLEIHPAPAQVHVHLHGTLPQISPLRPMPELTDQQIRDTVEATRR